ncbi:hypothetical protein HUW46_09066 [Amycolatopsis sp. CA-230715]|nr:hypothetical protein HUW46_09066 [Amycolatopsis sp. CA-230715]
MGGSRSVITGRLTWYGTTIACRECGSDKRWTLTVEQPADAAGELSWLDCEAGHRAQHPLIYPEIVHRVLRWTAAPADHTEHHLRPLADWAPRWTTVTSAPDQGPTRVYRDWTEPGPVDWERDWPELVQAQRRFDYIQDETMRLERAGVDTSWSIVGEGLTINGQTATDIEFPLDQQAVMSA